MLNVSHNFRWILSKKRAFIMRRISLSILAWFCFWPFLSMSQEKPPSSLALEHPPLKLSDFRPEPTLKVAETVLTHAKFPVIDLHTHFKLKLKSQEALRDFVKVMDANHIALCVSLDGGLGEQLQEHIAFLREHETRFAIFANIDWRGSGTEQEPATWACHAPNFVRHVCEQLRAAKKLGAVGLKVFKCLGLEVKNPDGSLVTVDDARWNPIWQTCGELQFPVLIHTADPPAFFQPVNARNERWEELSRHPEWSFHGEGFPTYAELMQQLLRVVERHPQTVFIGAHMASSAEDLTQLSQWLEKYPNLYVDLASRINELGRQPYTARKFILQHADRILFATDGPWPTQRLAYYWRFLETYDENFPYSEKEFPPQGFWRIHGIGLPSETLQKIYHQNALKLLPAIQEKFEKQKGAW
jgi:predicted TIM-barrel fold metal-dependent hydrolase